MNNIIPFQYGDITVQFNSDGWINATHIAKAHGKRLDVWLKTDETQQYINSFGRYSNTTKRWDLIRARKGNGGGTWLHPKLAVVFARWLNVDFAVWCDMHITDVLTGNVAGSMQAYNQALQELTEAQKVASICGQGLNYWKRQKSRLEKKIALLAARAQPMLPNM